MSDAGKTLNVLVLGVGGNVSQGILKALKKSSLSCRVVGACVSPLSLGLYTTDRSYVSPYANDPRFVDWLFDVCRTEQIDAVLSGVEPVLTVLEQHAAALKQETGALCIVSGAAQLQLGADKLLTCQWLQRNGFNYPHYADAADTGAVRQLIELCGYPLVAKPRGGKSAEGILIARKPGHLGLIAGRPGYVVQQYLGDDETEYTAGCFCDSGGAVRGTIVMRRGLLQGTTVWAEVGDYPDVRAEAERIAAALKPMGPCNVQLRVEDGRPVCFEINVRFSGTTPMRAHFGFNDVEMALRHFVLGETAPDLPVITSGVALRYWNEMYIDPAALAVMRQNGQLNPAEYAVHVEDYGRAE